MLWSVLGNDVCSAYSSWDPACYWSLTPGSKQQTLSYGIRSSISWSTLADANEQIEWRIFADFVIVLIKIALPLYAGDDQGLDLKYIVYALDAPRLIFVFLFFYGHSFDPMNHFA